MDIRWSFSDEVMNWHELSQLYRIAPLGDKPAEALSLVFTNSMFKCFAFDGDSLVGAGRALADGSDCSYICDVAVHPRYQSMGLGREIVSRLISLSLGHKKIILYANPGTERFYLKLGFKHMNTAMAIFENEAAALERGLVRGT